MDGFYIINFYPVIYIFSLFSTNHILLCLSSCVDIVFNLDSFSTIFAPSL
jgi:hypothetical protein